MITKILSRAQFNDTLIKEGWLTSTNDRFLICPFNINVRVCKTSGTFFTGMHCGHDYVIVGKLSNLRDTNWEYDDALGLISNGLAAFRIK